MALRGASRLALGTWQFGDTSGTWPVLPPAAEDAVVAAALAAGVNFFDTAEAYGAGESERALGRALRAAGALDGSRRGAIVVASKVLLDLRADAVRAACARTLANLGTPYLDLYQVHWPCNLSGARVPFAETFGALADLVRAGQVREIGVSNFGPADLADAVAASPLPISTNQLPLSLLARPIEFEIVAACEARGIGILAYSPLQQGLLTGRWRRAEDCPPGIARTRLFHHTRSPLCRHDEEGCEAALFASIDRLVAIAAREGRPLADLALRWAVQHAGVTAAIVGASKPEQIAANAAAAAAPRLAAELVRELEDATEAVKVHLGANSDLWFKPSRSR